MRNEIIGRINDYSTGNYIVSRGNGGEASTAKGGVCYRNNGNNLILIDYETRELENLHSCLCLPGTHARSLRRHPLLPSTLAEIVFGSAQLIKSNIYEGIIQSNVLKHLVENQTFARNIDTALVCIMLVAFRVSKRRRLWHLGRETQVCIERVGSSLILALNSNILRPVMEGTAIVWAITSTYLQQTYPEARLIVMHTGVKVVIAEEVFTVPKQEFTTLEGLTFLLRCM